MFGHIEPITSPAVKKKDIPPQRGDIFFWIPDFVSPLGDRSVKKHGNFQFWSNRQKKTFRRRGATFCLNFRFGGQWPASHQAKSAQQGRRSQARSSPARQASHQASWQGSRQAARSSQQGRRRQPACPQVGAARFAATTHTKQASHHAGRQQGRRSKVVAGSRQAHRKRCRSKVVAARFAAAPQAKQAPWPTSKAAGRRQGRRRQPPRPSACPFSPRENVSHVTYKK